MVGFSWPTARSTCPATSWTAIKPLGKYGSNGNDGGGGIFIGGGTVSLCNETVEYNITDGSGGGILIYGSTLYIDSFTLANTINNDIGNIAGTYVLQNC